MKYAGYAIMAVASKDNANQEELVRLWGSRVNKLTENQVQLVVEILQELEQRKKRVWQLG